MVMHILALKNQSHHAYFLSLKLSAQAMDFYALGIFGKQMLCTKTFMLHTWKDSAWIMEKYGNQIWMSDDAKIYRSFSLIVHV